MNRVGNPLHGSHMKRSGPVPSDVVAWASSAPGQGTRLELERKASQEPLPKQGLREILPLTVEQLEPEMSLQTPGLPFMQMTGQIAQGWLLPTTFPKWEDGVGVQLPKREQENPPGEPHPKDAKWLCTGLASKECFHLPGRLQPSEPPHSFSWKGHYETPHSISYQGGRARGWASGLGETMQPQTWNRTPGGTPSLEPPAQKTWEDTRRPSLQCFN